MRMCMGLVLYCLWNLNLSPPGDRCFDMISWRVGGCRSTDPFVHGNNKSIKWPLQNHSSNQPNQPQTNMDTTHSHSSKPSKQSTVDSACNKSEETD